MAAYMLDLKQKNIKKYKKTEKQYKLD